MRLLVCYGLNLGCHTLNICPSLLQHPQEKNTHTKLIQNKQTKKGPCSSIFLPFQHFFIYPSGIGLSPFLIWFIECFFSKITISLFIFPSIFLACLDLLLTLFICSFVSSLRSLLNFTSKFLIFFKTESCYVTLADLILSKFHLYLLSLGIKGMCYCAWKALNYYYCCFLFVCFSNKLCVILDILELAL